MKTYHVACMLLGLVLAAGLDARVRAQDAPTQPKLPEVAPAEVKKESKDSEAPAAKEAVPATTPAPELPPAPPEEPLPEGMLRLNFRGAPLETVLNYLSEAAGFIIVAETDVRGKIDAWSRQPVTQEEAFTILESALARNGYTAIRNGRTLTIVSKESARKRDIPVRSGNNPDDIPKDDQMVTQIIPVRFISATQLVNDLQPLLPSEATMTANDAGNALVITDTQVSIRRLTQIIRALDTSLAGANSVKVFALRFADAKELATVIKELYPAQDSRTTGGRGGFTGGFAGGFPGGFGGRGGATGGASGGSGSGNRAAASRVTAVADEHSNSLIVNAPDDAMPAIEELIRSVDTNVQDVTELRVFRLQYADPVEMAGVLSNLFPDDTRTSNNSGGRGQVRFGGFGGFGGGNRGGTTASTSERAMKKGRVLAVPDQRTSSVIVSADREIMDQIGEMVKQLDSNPARKQKVYVYDLDNADPQQVQEVLRGLFENQNSSRRTQTQNRNQNSALTTRSTQQQNNLNRVGNTGGFGGGGGGGGGGGVGGGGGGFGRGN